MLTVVTDVVAGSTVREGEGESGTGRGRLTRCGVCMQLGTDAERGDPQVAVNGCDRARPCPERLDAQRTLNRRFMQNGARSLNSLAPSLGFTEVRRIEVC